MEDFTSYLGALAALLFTLHLIYSHIRKRGLPPSPAIALPVVGHLLKINHQDPRQQMQKWREEVGDIFRLQLGPTTNVVLNGYELIKEAFLTRGDDFSDRPVLYFDWAARTGNLGIIFSSGENWKEHRSVSTAILRSMGMGRNILAGFIEEELREFSDLLSRFDGEIIDIRMKMGISTSNIICSLLVGQRFDYEDSKFERIVSLYRYNIDHMMDTGPAILNLFPYLHYIPGDLFGVKKIQDNRREISNSFITHFKELKGSKEYDEDNRDSFIANYVYEKKKRGLKGEVTHLNDENLWKTIEDLQISGVDTTCSSICWFILYMLHYPRVQEKIYREIISVTGSERMPNMQDKKKLIYLNASIMETQRLGNIAPFGVAHVAARDTTLRGYRIPKGTHVVGSLTSIFFDKQIWGEDVMDFRPERFLDNAGNLKHPEEFIPFSIGKRMCIGEAQAKMVMFLYISHLCHRFQFLAPDAQNPPKIIEVMGILRTPGPYEVKIVDRRVT